MRRKAGNPGKLVLVLVFAGFGTTCLFPHPAFSNPNDNPASQEAAVTRPTEATVSDVLNQLPVTFEPNVGQAPSEVQFLSRAAGVRLSLEKGKILVSLRRHSIGNRAPNELSEKSSRLPESDARPSGFEFSFPGANHAPQIDGLDTLETKTNYYIGQDPTKWHTNVTNYRRVRYHDLYAGVDLIFHGEQGALEYDFVVAPGTDPRNIKMAVRGPGQIRISKGAVNVAVGDSELQIARPDIYQIRGGSRASVRGTFVRVGPNVLGFQIGSYDHSLPLVIDPILNYGTFFAGTRDTKPVGVAVDSAGEIYIAGSTFATDIPTAAAYQSLNGGYENAFLSKISSSGTSLVFSTYIGGNAFDTSAGLAIDNQSNAYLLGNTSSSNFPTTPDSFRTACPPAPSCSAPFLSKFSPTGSLVYSTLLSVGANGQAIAVDSQHNAYITGAIDFPGLDLVNAFEPQYQGLVSTSTGNAFVQELNSSGTALVYSTYLAGSSGNGLVSAIGLGIAVDSTGSAYVTGNASPTNFPTRNISSTLNAGRGVFLVKFRPDGSDLLFADSISGSGTDTVKGIALDPMNNIYLTGSAGSTDFPVTPGAFQPSCTPVGSAICQNSQIFALEVSADGSTLLYSTLVGSGYPGGIAVDSSGRAYLTGTTAQSNFPTVAPIQSALQTSPGISQDAFVTALDPSGSPFFSTFLGGTATPDFGTGIAVDPTGGKIFVTGITGTGDFPLVNPGQGVSCCADAGFVITIDVTAPGPALSVSPRYEPFLYIRNVSTVPLNITSFASSDPAPLAGDCLPAHTLAPGTYCILVAGGGLSHTVEPYFTLTVTSNAPGSPNKFGIYEDTGLSQPRNIALLVTSANSLYFGDELIGTSSAPQSIVLTNIGEAPSTIDSITANSSGLTLSNTCPAILIGGASCAIQVAFAPANLTTFGGTVSITHELTNQRIDISANGYPVANGIQVSTQSIQFGSQFAGMTYQSRTVVLTNVSSGPVNLNSFALTGNYSQTNNCPSQLPGGANCRVFVTFTPSGKGESQGALTVTHNSAGGQATVQLDGTGLIRSDLSVSPLQLIFPGSTIIGTTNGPQTITLQNMATSTLNLSNISVAPSEFTITSNTCVGPLTANATCMIGISFTPSSAVPVSGALTIVHDGMGSPQIVTLTGTGTSQVTFTPAQLDFGDQQVGTTSSWHYLSASNLSSKTTVTISGASITGDFQIAQDPCSTIPPFYGCAFQITFTPTATGLRTGTFTMTASDSSTPHQVTVTGNGVAGGLEVSPGSLSFGNQFAGSTSGSQKVTVINVSGTLVNFQSIAVSGPFSQTNNCGTSLAIGANCTVQVAFSPTVLSDTFGRLTIQDDATGSPQIVSLSGTGTGTAVNLSAASLIFGNQAMGTVSSPSTISLTNQMSTALSISSISTSSDFGQTNSCGTSLPSGSSCNISVTFAPTAQGLRSGSLSILDNGPNTPQSVSLTGIGTLPPSASLSATSFDFGGILMNQQSAPQTLTVNVSNAPLTLQSIDFTSPQFRQQDQCTPTIAVGVPCTIFIFFQPTGLGSVTATMVIHDDTSNGSQSVQLTGSGSHYTIQPTSGTGQVITAGNPATFSLNFNSLSGFSETVSLSCSGAPAKAQCNLSQSTLSLNGNIQPLTVTVQTTPHSTSANLIPVASWHPVSEWFYILSALSISLILYSKVRVSWLPSRPTRIFSLVLLIGLTICLLSCGGGSGGGGTVVPTDPPPSQTGTPSGQYSIIVTGTSSNPANPPQTIQLPFTVN